MALNWYGMSRTLARVLRGKFSFGRSAVTKRAGRKSSQGHLALELLEDRTLLSITAQEQEFIYLLNRARHDPAAYQREAGLSVDLSAVAPSPPLAVNNALLASSQFHANEMATFDYVDHQSKVTGDGPYKMARDQGYQFTNDSIIYQAIDAGFSAAPSALQSFIEDSGVPSHCNRNNLLAIGEVGALVREIGVGQGSNASSTYRDYWAIQAADVHTTDRFLTGVVFNDANHNGRYDAGEGIAGVTVTAGGISTTTNEAGGWSIPIANSGTYKVNVSGSTFGGTSSSTVEVTDSNVEVDFISGQSRGIVNFGAVSAAARNQVASALTHSNEYYARVVTAAYQRYLKRDPEAAGLASWVSALQSGLTDERLEASFIGSPEYIHNHGGTGEAWVTGLYQDLLGRNPDQVGLNAWLTALHNGQSPADIAYGFAASPEREGQRITADYQTYLSRAPEADVVSAWVANFLHGASNEDVVAGFVGSAEYFAKHGANAQDWLFAAYQQTLGRTPDPASLDSWLEVLGQGA
jgi:hypothetical protein